MWRFLMNLEVLSFDRDHTSEAFVKVSSRSKIRNLVKTPPVLQLSVQQFHSVQVYKFPLPTNSLGDFSKLCNPSEPINQSSGGSSHFSGNTSPHVTSLATVLTATFVCILVLAAAVGFVLMCVKKKPRVVPTMTQQISTISGGYREFGLTPISTPATPQRKFLQETRI